MTETGTATGLLLRSCEQNVGLYYGLMAIYEDEIPKEGVGLIILCPRGRLQRNVIRLIPCRCLS